MATSAFCPASSSSSAYPPAASVTSITTATPIWRKFLSSFVATTSDTKRWYRNEGDAESEEENQTVDEATENDSQRSSSSFGLVPKPLRRGRSIKRYRSYLSLSKDKKKKNTIRKKKKKIPVETVEQLRRVILDEGCSLSETAIVEPRIEIEHRGDENDGDRERTSPPSMLNDHAVRNLIRERFVSGSTPGSRHNDTHGSNSTLALAIEGGGMRGCVSAGMVAAITALGLSDTIDTIYGSSAGSVIGAYLVSRQFCMDVYVDILPASKRNFVCKKRMVRDLATLGLSRLSLRRNRNMRKDDPSKRNYKKSYIYGKDAADANEEEKTETKVSKRNFKKSYIYKRNANITTATANEATTTATVIEEETENEVSLSSPSNKRKLSKRLWSMMMMRTTSSTMDDTAGMGSRRQPQHRPPPTPGMNISFILDGIMGDEHGLRPFDVSAFRKNNEKQKLRVVSSCVDPETGRLRSECFGTADFFDEDRKVVTVPPTKEEEDETKQQSYREGLFACLQASMTVPGATGPPVNIIRKKYSASPSSTSHIDQHDIGDSHQANIEAGKKNDPLPCFDAFCFEPIPYRSAVEDGATHVLVLTSRPEEYRPKTKRGVYETGVAPLYFHSHGHGEVAKFFAKGGQQYVYAEDLMLLEEAKRIQQKTEVENIEENKEQRKRQSEGVLVPPPEILYGVPRTEEITKIVKDRDSTWKRAHLFPLRVPKGHKELATLEQDKDEVLEAVRGGFSTAFDSLSDIVGLDYLDGKDVAELVFPSLSEVDDGSSSSFSSSSSSSSCVPEKEILGKKLLVPGELISENENGDAGANVDHHRNATFDIGSSAGNALTGRGGGYAGGGLFGSEDRRRQQHQKELSRTLLESLPGFREGKYGHLAKGLRDQSGNFDSATTVSTK